MTDLDLTEAVDAAAQALARQHYKGIDVWCLIHPTKQHEWREKALPAVQAAAPLIAAQLRAAAEALSDEWQAMSEVEHPAPADDLDVARVVAVSTALEECARELKRLITPIEGSEKKEVGKDSRVKWGVRWVGSLPALHWMEGRTESELSLLAVHHFGMELTPGATYNADALFKKEVDNG